MKIRLVILSGAGISAESGISTFRDSNGLWENHNIEEVATLKAWRDNPDLVTRFYNTRRLQVLNSKPNQAHFFLADLQRFFDVKIITQNIDDLHERAGSNSVLHLHGNIMYAKSSGPSQEKKFYKLNKADLSEKDVCDDGYRLRPHVVWFGEPVPEFEKAIELIEKADILLVIGTSLAVYPAANLVHYASNALMKIIVDPKANQFVLDGSFAKVNKSAVASIPDLKSLLYPHITN